MQFIKTSKLTYTNVSGNLLVFLPLGIYVKSTLVDQHSENYIYDNFRGFNFDSVEFLHFFKAEIN